MTCSVCHQDKVVTLEHGVKWGRGWVRWFICVPCELREREIADGRAVKAIEQAERAGA